MLTDSDLNKIGEVVDQRVAARLEPIAEELVSLRKGQQVLEKRQERLEKEQKRQGTDIRYTRKTLDIAIGRFDEDDVILSKRVTRLEKHVGLPPFE